jgi:aspartyl/asparaginyl beta-hydroxylase (cupin superfamily)
MHGPLDLASFPPLKKLAEHWRQIREEVATLSTENILPIDRQDKSHAQVVAELQKNGQRGWVQAWGPTRHLWLNYLLLFHDKLIIGDAGLPFTTGLLAHLRGVKVAALSMFRSGACLPIHDHPELAEENLFTFHLALDAASPSHSYLYSEGDFKKEEPGAAFVFDGSKPHFAFNCSTRDRTILYVEFSRSLLRWVK